MFCSLSGEVAIEPTLSPKSGHIFERRLIEKYIADEGKDPVSGDVLAVSDLIAVKSSNTVKPRAPTAASIPSMLAAFQNEWDAVMLETYSLKQQLEQARQELSHSLYQHEAACRVIARISKERDAARQLLGTFAPTVSNGQEAAVVPTASDDAAHHADSAMDVDETAASSAVEASTSGLSQAVLDKIIETSQTLQKGRRKRPASETLATPEQVASFKQLSSSSALHSSSAPGLTTVDIHPDGNLVISGGVDKHAVVFDRAQGVIVHTLKGHTKRITASVFHRSSDIIFTASQDKTARIWQLVDGKTFKTQATIKEHKGDITDLSLHATGDYIGLASLDSTWSFIDVHTGQTLVKVSSNDVTKGYTRAQFHPDGLILGTGTTDSMVRMWDVKTLTNVASFEAHAGKITDLAFSENGYYLATAAEDSTVKLWDLRKLANFRSIQLDQDQSAHALDFDYSGSYLAVAGSGIKVFGTKNWNEIVNLTDHTGPITDIKFGKDAHSIVSASLDRSLRFFGFE